jgi:hypothetical protein
VVRPPYEVALRLCFIAGERWAEIDGEAALKGADLIGLPLDRFCNAIYFWVIQRVEEDDRDMFLARLYEPLPGREPSPETVKMEMDSFAEFASAFGAAPR